MESIKHRNNPDGGMLFIIIIGFGGYFLLPLYQYSVAFALACFALLMLLVFLRRRTVKISVDSHFIAVRFLFLNIPYNIIRRQFDAVKVSEHDIGSVIFIKENKEVLEFRYEDDIAEPTVEIGMLYAKAGKKEYSVGNSKTAYQIFNEIRQITIRQTQQEQ